jgi:DNA-binding transcriptional regulator YiaG
MTMKKHTQDTPTRPGAEVRVLDGSHRAAEVTKHLEDYDASALVGLHTIVCDAAIERVDTSGERTVEVPKLRELSASAAVSRCLMPIRLRGAEIKAMRKIMRLTLGDLAKRLDDRTAPETISRWESEAQPMGGYAEKILRLLVCEELKKEAPGIDYDGSKIAHLKVVDPWRADSNYKAPPVTLTYMPMRVDHTVIEAWNEKKAA